MESSTGFSCPGCGRQYAWRPEYEGKQVTCKCGVKVRPERPVEMVAAAQPVAASRAMTTTATSGGRTVTVASGYVVGHRARPQVAQDDGGTTAVREWVGPIVLLMVGLVGRAVELGVMRSAHGPGIGVAAGFAAGGVLLMAVAVALGVLGAAQVMGSELDGPGVLARKVLGIAAFAAFFAVLSASIDKEPGQFRGLIVALHVVMLIYFVGISYLLKMDLLEALMATVIAIAVQVGLFLAIAQALPAATGRLLFYGS